MIIKSAAFFSILVLPQFANAAVVFSEIMYDAPGGDTDHEWIEIQNTGDSPVDISGYKLREGTTNHTLSPVSGGKNISTHGFAIIAKTPAIFLKDNPNFSGVLFDSTFSLSNTGETLVLKDNMLADSDSVSYSSSEGASGNGQTLQKINDSWTTGYPTPGAANVFAAPPEKEIANTQVSNPSPKKAPSINTTKKLSSAKVAKALETPPNTPNQEAGAVDLSTYTDAKPANDAWKWYVGLGALVFLGIGGILALRLNSPGSKSEYEIVE